jgi:hypothetical protein
MRRLTELAVLTFLINLTSCVPPTEEITVATTEELESAVAVALHETQIAQPPPTAKHIATETQHPASNCQDLFPDAVEISARDYLDKLEESWFRVLENNDTYSYVDPSGSIATNGPWATWFYEMAIQDVSSEFPEQFESVIAYGDHKVEWDEYLDYAQAVCDAYTSTGTRRSSQIALEKLINHDRHNNSHASRWEVFEYIDTGPSIIESPSPPGLEHYTQYITGGGVIIVGGAAVPDEALLAARESVVYMTSVRPDFQEILKRNEVRISLFGPEGDTSVLPEFSYYNDPGGLAMAMTDASMAANAGTQCYPGHWDVGGNTVIHEMAHTINHVVFEEINEIFFCERIYDIAVQAIDSGIFPAFEGQPVSVSVGEFWAKTVEGYIMNRPGFTDSHDTRDWIAENDPELYELITRYFPADEWIYCPGVEEQRHLFGPDHPYSQP